MSDLSSFTDVQLLAEIVRRNGAYEAPTKVSLTKGEWQECVVGIGKDNTASIYIDSDALKMLL
jgi:hypothetical protein